MTKPPSVRFRVDFGRQCSIGIGKIELLEGIARCGSLSESARRMRMSYRRAWLLLADLNAYFDEPVTRATTGGRGGGGALLTDFGASVVSTYRNMEVELESLAAAKFGPLAERVTVSRKSSTAGKVPKAAAKRAKT